jgi:hypothetical protein
MGGRFSKETNQRKFNKQWQKLDELTGKKRSEDAAKTRTAQDEAEALCPLPTDTARTRRRAESAVKTFSKWIENEPKEKWALLYDTDGARYSIMTTNFTEVYNWVMRGVCGLPLVAIMKFIVHGCIDYNSLKIRPTGCHLDPVHRCSCPDTCTVCCPPCARMTRCTGSQRRS